MDDRFHMRWSLSVTLLFIACGTGSLPDLPPETTEDPPQEVQILGVWSADGTEQLGPAALGVGRAYGLRVRVAAFGDRPLASEPLVATIESDSFERVLSFPRGNTCLTPAEPESADDEGICTIVFFAEGLVRDVALRVRAQRALNTSDVLALGLKPDVDQPRLRFIVPGVGTASWVPGDADPLAALQPLRLSLEDPQAVPLVIELKDPYGNPLSGHRVELTPWLEPQDEPQPSSDAGASSEGGTSDASLAADADVAVQDDVGLNPTPDAGADVLGASDVSGGSGGPGATDTGPGSDVGSDIAHTSDAGAAADGGTTTDAGQTRPAGAIADGRVIVHRLAAGQCSTEAEAEEQHDAMSDVLGRATFCLKAGEDLGAWQLVLRLDDLVPPEQIAARSQDGFVLSGRTRAGDPDRLVLLGHNDETEPLSRCEPGDVTPLEYFQVLSASGRPVAGAEVNITTDGAVRLLSFANPVSDEQGRVAVQVSCPVTMPTRSTIHATLAGANAGEAQKRALFYVRLEVQVIERLRLMTDQPGQAALNIGRGRAFEPMYFRVLAEGSRGTPATQSRLNLELHTSQDNNDLLFLEGERCVANPERSVKNQSVYTDADGVYRFALCAMGLSTILRPMALIVRAHGQTAQLHVPIVLLAGAPERVLADPPGRVTTLVGGSAGALDVVVFDQAGNGVSNVAIEIVAPPAVELSRSQGNTNALGRFSTWITAVTMQGEHELTLRASQGNWSGLSAKTVAAGLGTADRIGLYQNGRLLVSVLGAAQLDLPVGGSLERPMTLRLENREGGGVPGEGIAATLIEGEPNQCGRIGIDGRVTNAQGEVVFGGESGVALESGPVVTHCLWRFSAGIDLQALLRVRQVAGAPYGGSPEADQGVQLTALQQPPTDWNQGAPMTTEVRVRATDRFGNPKAGLRMWLNATNCWIENPLQQLGPNEELGWAAGEGVWRVAGGRDHGAPCTLYLRYPGGEWEDARPLVIPIQGLPLPVIKSVDRFSAEGYRNYDCPEQTYHSFNGCYYRGGHIQLTQTGGKSHHLKIDIDEELVIRPDALIAQMNATCYQADLEDPYANCSHIQVLDVQETDGENVYRALADLPIRWRVVRPEWNTNRTLEFYVDLPERLLADGRHKALRIVQPDGHTTGPAHRIYASPPIRWRRSYTRVLSPDDAEEQALLWGGHRLQLDEDEAQEAVFCGHDSRGGILAVIDRQNNTDPYPETIQGIRLWSLDAQAKIPTAQSANLACPFGDFNDDGRRDLVIPLPNSPTNRIPRLMLIPGQAEAPFFSVADAVTVLLTNAPAYPAQPPRQLAVSRNPNRIWACFGYLRDGVTHFRGACEENGTVSVYIQSNPFVENPNQAIGAQVAHEQFPILRPFQVRHQVHFDGLGTINSAGHLIGGVKPWPEMPLNTGAHSSIGYFNEDDRSLTTINTVGEVIRWDDQGRVTAEFLTPQEAPYGTFSQDGGRVASVVDGVVYVWRVSDGSLLYALPGHTLAQDSEFLTDTYVRWTAVNERYPESFLVLGMRETQRPNCDGSTHTRMHWRVYNSSGEFVSESLNAEPYVRGCLNHPYFFAASPGAETIYTGRRDSTEIKVFSGVSGERVGELTQPRAINVFVTNKDASKAFIRTTVWNTSPHPTLVALPSGQVLWETCVNGAQPGCGHRLNSDTIGFSPDDRFLIRRGDATVWNISLPSQYKGRFYLPTGGPYLENFSSNSGYALARENHNGWVQSWRDIHVLPVDQRPGGVTPITYASNTQITQRARRPEHHAFYFGTWLVGQEEDDGDAMILPRRRYMDGLLNRGNNWGGEYGHTDCLDRCDNRGYWLGDGEIVVVRPETWRPGCGNGQTEPGELIDTGQPWNERWDCGASLISSCGNNNLDAGEECDDGNQSDDDGCAGCLVTHPGWLQDHPLASCADLPDDAANGSYWLGERADAYLNYCLRSNDAWWTLAARFTNDDGLQWRDNNWTAGLHTFGPCAELQQSNAQDCRSVAWDYMSTQELLAVERLERNDQVYEGTRLYRLDQARTMTELASLPADTNVLASTQLISGGDNILALAPTDNPPQLLVNYDLGNDGCRLATSSNSHSCTSGLACRQDNRNYWCHGDVNTDSRDTMNHNQHGNYAWPNHIVHLFVRAAGN
jgi:cysteine-rich repeat protein